ncbi:MULTISPECIES: membrane protein [Paenibacillus]|uniref:Uncharacterized protein n=2 Tax=Paenibacillus TaxID=44249 RepID=A0A919Y3U9_9BACL|nr:MULTISPECIES: membrane protein [Paenibacillus]GIO37618.1 hypothetical protein J41TS12_24790 [Paenibacillus antibioticophila]GIO43274.1 hypothetical protein J41TS4_30320 [Paenibacillus apis]
MTIVDLSDISIELFIAVMFFLLIIAPLVSLGILRLFQGKKKVGLSLIGSGVIGYFMFQLIVGLLV